MSLFIFHKAVAQAKVTRIYFEINYKVSFSEL